MSKLSIIDNLYLEKEKKIILNYQIFVSNEAIYLVNSSKNYSKFAKAIFSGIGDIAGLFGDAVGIIGGLASELTGNKISKLFSQLSESKSQSKVEKVLKNLDKYAESKKGITKIVAEDLKRIVVKKGFIINGKSYVEIHSSTTNFKVFAKDRTTIDKLVQAIDNNLDGTEITTKFL